MKTFLIFISSISFVGHSFSDLPFDYRRIEAEQVALWEQKLKEAKSLTPEKRISYLWLGLRNMGHRKSSDNHSSEVQIIYQKIQDELLSIPGHARYFADEIKREQHQVAHYPTVTGPRGTYDFNRGLYFLTMRHLPSPETIAVLGDFLADDKDQPDPRDPSKSYDYDIPLANSHHAAETLDKIGLRDPPVPPARHQVSPLIPEDYLPYARAWWDEVESGNRTFSFKGQAVEYRFKQDGTWETIPIANPPDDGPQSTHKSSANRPVKRPGAVRADPPESPDGHAWWKYGIGGAALLALGAWLWRKRKA
jgi:hypothetical protein